MCKKTENLSYLAVQKKYYKIIIIIIKLDKTAPPIRRCWRSQNVTNNCVVMAAILTFFFLDPVKQTPENTIQWRKISENCKTDFNLVLIWTQQTWSTHIALLNCHSYTIHISWKETLILCVWAVTFLKSGSSNCSNSSGKKLKFSLGASFNVPIFNWYLKSFIDIRKKLPFGA